MQTATDVLYQRVAELWRAGGCKPGTIHQYLLWVRRFHKQHAQATATLGQLAAEARVLLCAVNVTAHESFTRIRYNARLDAGIDGYSWMRSEGLQTIQFADADEVEALSLIRKYSSVNLSFHDALCAAVMLRLGIYRIFSFDADFWTFGFELIPGVIRRR